MSHRAGDEGVVSPSLFCSDVKDQQEDLQEFKEPVKFESRIDPEDAVELRLVPKNMSEVGKTSPVIINDLEDK